MIEQRWIKIRLTGYPYRPAKEAFPPANYPSVDSIMQVWRDGRAMSMQYLTEHTAELDTPRQMLGIFGGAAIQATPRDLFTHALPYSIEDNLVEIEYLFDSFFHSVPVAPLA